MYGKDACSEKRELDIACKSALCIHLDLHFVQVHISNKKLQLASYQTCMCMLNCCDESEFWSCPKNLVGPAVTFLKVHDLMRLIRSFSYHQRRAKHILEVSVLGQGHGKSWRYLAIRTSIE